MTNSWTDIKNTDLVIVMGGNAAEAHPCGFKWVTEAKAQRGAKLIVVDPRFTRTASVADFYAPIRQGTDIAFLLGVIRYCIENDKIQHDYVRAFTNAPYIVKEGFSYQDGLFSGYDEAKRDYDRTSWEYELGPDGYVQVDETLQNPRCVYQLLKKHVAAYTPEMVEQVCGVPREEWLKVAQTLAANSGRERTSAICYAVGWTQQSKGVQIIRAASILQMLLGNMGRPGGGIMALRGHASIQGSTDVPTLYDLLSGYMPQPAAMLQKNAPEQQSSTRATEGAQPKARMGASQQTLDEYIQANGSQTGWWVNLPTYMRSFLQAWYGPAADAENGALAYRWIPKITGDHSHLVTSYAMLDGRVKGYFLLGQNPAAGSTNARMQRQALEQLDWMVVRDLYEVESAAFWHKGPEPVDPTTVKTEVFLLPAAASTEKPLSESHSRADSRNCISSSTKRMRPRLIRPPPAALQQARQAARRRSAFRRPRAGRSRACRHIRRRWRARWRGRGPAPRPSPWW